MHLNHLYRLKQNKQQRKTCPDLTPRDSDSNVYRVESLDLVLSSACSSDVQPGEPLEWVNGDEVRELDEGR